MEVMEWKEVVEKDLKGVAQLGRMVGGGNLVLFGAAKWSCSLVVAATMVPENHWETTLTMPGLICEWPK